MEIMFQIGKGITLGRTDLLQTLHLVVMPSCSTHENLCLRLALPVEPWLLGNLYKFSPWCNHGYNKAELTRHLIERYYHPVVDSEGFLKYAQKNKNKKQQQKPTNNNRS